MISPSTGAGVPFTQLGVGTSPGYGAIDLRRTDTIGLAEAPMSLSCYTVGQRGAGANMSVDIAANVSPGCIVQGDTVTPQGRYVVAPHSAVINEVIAAADPTNPRIDSVVLEVKDTTYDASGLNQAQTRVITGTPTAAATTENPLGVAALPNTAILLAYVLVGAGVSSITTANCKDMRPKRRGKLNIAASESTSATTYAFNNLTTPDRITQIVLPTDGLLIVGYHAIWQNTVASNAKAAVFIGANQIKRDQGGGATAVQEATGNATINIDVPLASSFDGLVGASSASAGAAEVTTGQILSQAGSTGGWVEVFLAAGTYDVSVQYKNVAAGTLTAKNRHLWVETRDYDAAMFS